MNSGKDLNSDGLGQESRSAREQILFGLKLRGPRSATQLAEETGFTYVAIKKQLAALAAEGHVRGREGPTSVGRPCQVWELTGLGNGRFADRHGEMLTRIVFGVREMFGESGLASVMARALDCSLGKQILGVHVGKGLPERLQVLFDLRREQGYMPQLVARTDGSYTFIENHCPVERLAQTTDQVCACELDIFKGFLEGATVARTEHLVDGGRRCVYEVRPLSLDV
jgi:predicted ArsR family transcriptional regulator